MLLDPAKLLRQETNETTRLCACMHPRARARAHLCAPMRARARPRARACARAHARTRERSCAEDAPARARARAGMRARGARPLGSTPPSTGTSRPTCLASRVPRRFGPRRRQLRVGACVRAHTCMCVCTHICDLCVPAGACSLQRLTAVGFEPTALRTGAWSQRLRPLGQTVLPNWPLVLVGQALCTSSYTTS